MSTPTLQGFEYELFDSFSPYADVGPYRAADYWRLPEGERVELIEGRFVMSPAPTPLHQFVLLLLSDLFLDIARRSGGIGLFAPTDVVLSDDTILQPDLLYITKARRGIVKQRIEGAPDLVVEILSPGAKRRDRIQKLDTYARYEVGEYWIVDARAKLFEFLVNDGGNFVVQSPARNRYHSPKFQEVQIDLAAFWREVDDQWPADAR